MGPLLEYRSPHYALDPEQNRSRRECPSVSAPPSNTEMMRSSSSDRRSLFHCVSPSGGLRRYPVWVTEGANQRRHLHHPGNSSQLVGVYYMVGPKKSWRASEQRALCEGCKCARFAERKSATKDGSDWSRQRASWRFHCQT
jgi:hypothetical protein